MSEFECPYCHHIHEGDAPIDVLPHALKQSANARTILKRLIAAYPRGVSLDRLRSGLYCGDQTVFNILCGIRKAIRPLGWDIPVIRRSDTEYEYRLLRLVPIEEGKRAA